MAKKVLERAWYYYLVPKKDESKKCLFNFHSREALRSKLIVCLSQPKHKLFSVFRHSEFYNNQKEFEESHRNFFEVILGEYPQKLKFDIDIEKSKLPNEENIEKLANLLKDECIASIESVLTSLGLKFDVQTNILLFSSHRPDDPETVKRSFHIVVSGYYCENNNEAKKLYDMVVAKVSENYRHFIDSSIYSSIQQFRMLGSQKFGSGRIKKFLSTYSYQGREIFTNMGEPEFTIEECPFAEDYHLFLSSLISYVIHCKPIPRVAIELPKSWISTSSSMIDEKLSKSIMECLAEHLKIKLESELFPYSLNDIKGNMLILKRNHAFKCLICDRLHEHENPFIYISGFDINFCCRREGRKSIVIGNLQYLRFRESLAQKSATTLQEDNSEIKGDEEYGFVFNIDEDKNISQPKQIRNILENKTPSNSFASEIKPSSDKPEMKLENKNELPPGCFRLSFNPNVIFRPPKEVPKPAYKPWIPPIPPIKVKNVVPFPF